MLTVSLLDTEYVGLGPSAKETPVEDGDQIQIMRFVVVLEHLIGQI